MATLREMEQKRISVVSTAQKAANLKAEIASFEKKHGRTTNSMIKAVREGKERESAEVATWFFNYRALMRLEGRSGATIGTRMTIT